MKYKIMFKAWHGLAWHGRARQGGARLGGARQGIYNHNETEKNQD